MLPCRPRWKDIDYFGKYRYVLTFCTHDRRLDFTRHDIVSLTWSQILRAVMECCFHITAHVASYTPGVATGGGSPVWAAHQVNDFHHRIPSTPRTPIAARYSRFRIARSRVKRRDTA